jgi:hypothetical protein
MRFRARLLFFDAPHIGTYPDLRQRNICHGYLMFILRAVVQQRRNSVSIRSIALAMFRFPRD